MPMRGTLATTLVVWAVVGALPGVAAADAEPAPGLEPEERISDAVIDPENAWALPGVRVALVFGYGLAAADASAPPLQSITIGARGGYRIGPRWSVMGSLRYGILRHAFCTDDGFERSCALAFNGMRWAATLEPELHLGDDGGGLTVAVGLGYGGLLGDRADAAPIDYEDYLLAPDLIDLRGEGVADELPPLPACDGDGVVGLVRASYAFVVGDVFATGPAVELSTQWTSCLDHGFEMVGLGEEDLPAEARYLVPRQWWGHYAVEVTWVFAWR